MTTGFERYSKKTRRAQFLEEMEQVVPWRDGGHLGGSGLSETTLRRDCSPALCVNNSETSSPSTITVGAEKDSHLHEQDQW